VPSSAGTSTPSGSKPVTLKSWTTNGECFLVVGHIAGYGDGGGGRGAARSWWKAGPSVLIGFIIGVLN